MEPLRIEVTKAVQDYPDDFDFSHMDNAQFGNAERRARDMLLADTDRAGTKFSPDQFTWVREPVEVREIEHQEGERIFKVRTRVYLVTVTRL